MAKIIHKKRRSWDGGHSIQQLKRKIIRDHEDILQNIEFVLVNTWRGNPQIDDHDVAEALRAALAGRTSIGEFSDMLLEGLLEARSIRMDIPDDIWRAALDRVLDSVKLHSQLTAGERSYLLFIDPFIK